MSASQRCRDDKCLGGCQSAVQDDYRCLGGYHLAVQDDYRCFDGCQLAVQTTTGVLVVPVSGAKVGDRDVNSHLAPHLTSHANMSLQIFFLDFRHRVISIEIYDRACTWSFGTVV